MWGVFYEYFEWAFTWTLNFLSKLKFWLVGGYRVEMSKLWSFYRMSTRYSFRHKMDEGWFELRNFLHTKLYVSVNSMKSKAETVQFWWHASILAELIQVVTIGHFMRLKSGFYAGNDSTFPSGTFLGYFSGKRNVSRNEHIHKDHNKWSITPIVLSLYKIASFYWRGVWRSLSYLSDDRENARIRVQIL